MNDQATDITVLTIEDDAALRRSISAYLEDSGCRVLEASCGDEGLHLFRMNRPDIVYTDLNMPNINGLDLIPQLREECPSTPIVVISGTGAIHDAVEAMKRGAWDFVSKPVRDFAVLDAMTSRLVEQSRKIKLDALAQQPGQNQPATSLTDKTGLYRIFNERSTTQPLSLIIVNLDRFKALDASLGQSSGMDLIRLTADRFTSVVTDNDIVAHLEADEFAIITAGDDAHIRLLVQSIRDMFRDPFIIDDQELFASACQGVVLSHQGSQNIDDLLRCAGIALSMARTNGRNSVQYYEAGFGNLMRKRNELESQLRRALDNNEFELHYQPQYLLESGHLAGAEALVRWRRPGGELVPPSDFIPVLEESGLIIPAGEFILRKACQQYMAWRLEGIPPFTISVNISVAQFKSGTLVPLLLAIANETGMDLSHLCLELTESIVMDDIDHTIQSLEELKSLGVHLSIDDFGTGYSSLSYLRKMPICELKIDRSFISTLPHDESNGILVITILNMARCMNIRVVAEGVEHEDQARFLTLLGCEMAQGYLYGKPVNDEEFANTLRNRSVVSQEQS